MHHLNNVPATIPLALHALTGHMVEKQLPAPHDITLRHDDRVIQVHIIPEHLVPWLQSGFHDDTETVTPLAPSRVTGKWVRVDIDGRLPSAIGDVPIRLSYFRREERPALKSVQA